MSDGLSIEGLGIALGLGEEIGQALTEDREAREESSPEPLSLQENYSLKCKITHKKQPRKGSFEEWMRLVISGEIDPYNVEMYPRNPDFEDPM